MTTVQLNANAVINNNTNAVLALANMVANKQQCYVAETEMLFAKQLQEVKDFYNSIKNREDMEELVLLMLEELDEELEYAVDGDGVMTEECVVALYLTRKCANLTEALVNAALATLQDDVTAVAVTH